MRIIDEGFKKNSSKRKLITFLKFDAKLDVQSNKNVVFRKFDGE